MNQAASNCIEKIESWFRLHEDGAFCVIEPEVASVRVGDFTKAQAIIYTTKYHCIPRIKSVSQWNQPVAIWSRYGLPISQDVPSICGSVSVPFFIGDADPPDLLVFAWLREHFPIIWHGVNDAFLVHHGTRYHDQIRIPLTDFERSSIPLLRQVCPDFRDLLGKYCSSLIESGFKIELEGAVGD